jgi:hypothetical protein
VIAPLADDRGAGVIQKESRLGRGVTVARLTLENAPKRCSDLGVLGVSGKRRAGVSRPPWTRHRVSEHHLDRSALQLVP